MFELEGGLADEGVELNDHFLYLTVNIEYKTLLA